MQEMPMKRLSTLPLLLGTVVLLSRLPVALAEEPRPSEPSAGRPEERSPFESPELEAPEPEREQDASEDRIETDRDSFTPSVRTAGRGLTILESSYSFLDNRGVPETHSFPELLVRHGLTE